MFVKGSGASNQTISARNWQRKKDGKFNFVWCIDLVLGSDHCVMAWIYWSVRK